MRLSLRWRPRDENAEADDLTNGRVGNFDKVKRIQVAVADLDLSLLDQLWANREEFLDKQSCSFYTPDSREPFEKTRWGD